MSITGMTHAGARGVTPIDDVATTPVTGGNQEVSRLLPAPSRDAVMATGDAILMVMALATRSRDAARSAREANLNVANHVNEAVQQEVAKKYKEWLADQNNPFKVFADVLKVVGMALSAVAAVASGGALSALMVGAIALSVASMVVDKTKCFGKDSAFASLGLNIASAVVALTGSVGTMIGAGASTAANGAGKAVDVGTKVAAQAEATADTANKGAKVFDLWLGLGNSAVQLGSASTQTGTAVRDYQAAMDQADLQQKHNAQKSIDQYIQAIIEGLTDLEQSHRTAVDTLSSAEFNANQALVLSATKG